MQLAAMFVWLALSYGLAKLVNLIAKRPLMNPWSWFGSSYALLYALALVVGLARNTPNFAYLAGYYLPITLVAVVLAVWRAPKWRALHQSSQPGSSAIAQAPDLRA